MCNTSHLCDASQPSVRHVAGSRQHESLVSMQLGINLTLFLILILVLILYGPLYLYIYRADAGEHHTHPKELWLGNPLAIWFRTRGRTG